MPIITYEGTELSRSQREALIKAFARVAHQIVPSIPEEANYVLIKEIGKGESGKARAGGNQAKGSRMDDLLGRLEKLESDNALTKKVNKTLASKVTSLEAGMELMRSGQQSIVKDQEEMKEDMAGAVMSAKGLPVLFSLIRLLSLPELEKHKDTIFPFVRKLTTLHKKQATGKIPDDEAKEKLATIMKGVQTELKKRDIDPPLLTLPK